MERWVRKSVTFTSKHHKKSRIQSHEAKQFEFFFYFYSVLWSTLCKLVKNPKKTLFFHMTSLFPGSGGVFKNVFFYYVGSISVFTFLVKMGFFSAKTFMPFQRNNTYTALQSILAQSYRHKSKYNNFRNLGAHKTSHQRQMEHFQTLIFQ